MYNYLILESILGPLHPESILGPLHPESYVHVEQDGARPGAAVQPSGTRHARWNHCAAVRQIPEN
jgi:hypothetical protein